MRTIPLIAGLLLSVSGPVAHSQDTQTTQRTPAPANAEAYFQFIELCAKHAISKPIYPGIMPIGNFSTLVRFSNNCGADIPRWLQQRVASLDGDKEAIAELGIEIVSRLCETLLAGGAPGLHFYTMNNASTTTRICRDIGLD